MNVQTGTGRHFLSPVLILLLLLAAALAGNLFAPRLFMGFNYLLGSIAVLLVLRVYGLLWSLTAALLAASATIVLFRHPFALVWLCLEPVVIGLLLRRFPYSSNMVLFSALYWTLLGVPLIFLFFLGIQGASLAGTLPAAMMYWLIGVTNALVASLLLNIAPFASWIGLRKKLQSFSLRQMVFNMLMAVVVVPAVLVMVLNGRSMERQSTQDALNQISAIAQRAPLALSLALERRDPAFVSENLLSPLKAVLPQGIYITALDEKGRVIASSRPGVELAIAYNPLDRCERIQITDEIYRAMPLPEIPTPLWQRIQRSTLVQERHIEGSADWRLLVEMPLAGQQQRLLQRQTESLGLLIGLIVAALLTALLFSRWLAAPLHHLSQATTNLPARISGHKKIAYPVTRIREIDQLIDNFQDMSQVLAEKFTEITEANETLERRVQQRTEELHYLATHDSLTGLPNRTLLFDRLELALAQDRRHHRSLGLILLDLDNFKMVNDTLGHTAGDLLLQEVALRLRGCVRGMDTVARLGGDEFVILVGEVESVEGLGKVAEKILDAFKTPFQVNSRELFMTTSVGVTLSPNDGTEPDGLLKNADTAMYQAKRLGKNNFQFFTQEMDLRVRGRLDLETRLRRALEKEEFLLHFQPQIDLVSHQIIGMEALIRWQKEAGRLVPPVEFIPILEETGLIVPAGLWVLDTAIRQAALWQTAGSAPLQMAVNISARQFYRESLPDQIQQILEYHQVPSTGLTLELTESVLIQDIEESVRKLRALKEMGICIAIDDFGTGYSSLAYLKRLPIDEIKIDRDFIAGIFTSPNDATLVEAIIDLSHKLGMAVVAEGVETTEQQKFLIDRGCEKMQGYLFSRPLPAAEVSKLLNVSRS